MLIGLEFLKRVLFDKDYDVLVGLRENLFIDRDELNAYRSILEYHALYGKLPPVSFIKDDLEIYKEHPIAYWLDKLKERYLEYVLNKIRGIIDSNENAEDKLDIVIKTINETPDKIKNIDVYYKQDLVDICKEDINKLRESYFIHGKVGVPTGWRTLDNHIGGYSNGDVTVFCARPKTGKSMLLIYSANAILENGKKVMFVSMEMTKEQILRRLAALRSNIRYNVFKGAICSFGEQLIVDRISEISDRLILVEGQLRKTILALNSLFVIYKPDIVFIDGAYLIRTYSKNQPMWERVSEIIGDIKHLAMINDIPIVCSYQFNREIGKRDASIEHIAFADAIGQIASNVIGILEDESGHRRLELIASRDAPIVSFHVNWDWETMNFSEIGGESLYETEQGACEESEANFEDVL